MSCQRDSTVIKSCATVVQFLVYKFPSHSGLNSNSNVMTNLPRILH